MKLTPEQMIQEMAEGIHALPEEAQKLLWVEFDSIKKLLAFQGILSPPEKAS